MVERTTGRRRRTRTAPRGSDRMPGEVTRPPPRHDPPELEEVRVVEGRRIRLSHPDKVFYPDEGITKRDVADYYERVADFMLPYVRGRLVSMHRWPEGIDGKSFYQKQAPDYFPEWIRTERVEKEGGVNQQVVIDDRATLVYLASQACLTPHVWLSRVDDVRRPDLLVFDFDPPDYGKETFTEVRWAARRVREVLELVGLGCRVMTSGSRGLHVHASITPSADFAEAKRFARDVAELLAWRHPGRLTTEIRKNKRAGRVFIDYLRNDYAQTSVAPYALRARPGAPVAMPIDWRELGASRMSPTRYTLRNTFRRLARKRDPWMEGASGDMDARDLRGARNGSRPPGPQEPRAPTLEEIRPRLDELLEHR